MGIRIPKGLWQIQPVDINKAKTVDDMKVMFRKLYDDLQKLNAYINTESSGLQAIITDHKKLTNLDYDSAGHTGFQPTLDFTAEDVANKITAWGTPTDTQYPSAKLVKDSLDLLDVSASDFGKSWCLVKFIYGEYAPTPYTDQERHLLSDGDTLTGPTWWSGDYFTFFHTGNILIDKVRFWFDYASIEGEEIERIGLKLFYDGVWNTIYDTSDEYYHGSPAAWNEITLATPKVVSAIALNAYFTATGLTLNEIQVRRIGLINDIVP